MNNYININLLDTARLCGLDILGSTLGSDEIQARCPYCQDYKYRMYICTDHDNQTFHCKNCGEAGNAVTLYADFNPAGIFLTTKEAYIELTNHPAIGTDFSPYQERVPAVKNRIKPLAERSKIYLELLRLLTLKPEHRNNLRARGLSDEMIRGNMYRSIPTDYRVRQLAIDKLSALYDLSDMPGFYTKDARWRMAGKSGILIPVCDSNNQIQGLQIRLDEDSKHKYIWLSSPRRYYENGTSVSGFIHVAGDVSSDILHISEGPLKSDIASFLSGGQLFLGLTGVHNIKHLSECLSHLKPKKIVECIDMDKVRNPDVQTAAIKISEICKPLCEEYEEFYWSPNLKGIDDYLLSLCNGCTENNYLNKGA